MSRLDVYVHFDFANGATAKLDQILAQLGVIQTQENAQMNELEDLKGRVKETTDAEQSAIVLLQGLKARLDAAGTDAAALSQLSADLQSNTDALAAAVVANTPAA